MKKGESRVPLGTWPRCNKQTMEIKN